MQDVEPEAVRPAPVPELLEESAPLECQRKVQGLCAFLTIDLTQMRQGIFAKFY